MKTSILPSLAAVLCLAGTATLHAEPWQPLGPEGGHVDTLLATPGSGNTRVLAMTSGGLFKSDDAGRSWQETGRGLRAGMIGNLIAQNVIQPKQLYLLEGGFRLMRSEDGGDSWVPTGFRLPVERSASAIAVTSGSVLYSNFLGTFRSTDGGVTFAPVFTLPTNRAMNAFAVDPETQNMLAGVEFSYPDEPALYASADAGASWVPVLYTDHGGRVTDLRFLGGGNAVAAMNVQVYLSIGGYYKWQPRLELAGIRVVRPRASGNELVAMNGRQCYRSVDLFATMTDCSGGLPSLPADRYDFNALVAVADGNDYRVLATARDVGVIALENAGSTWVPSAAGLRADSRRGLVLWPSQPTRIVAGRATIDNYSPAVADSRDGGATWQQNLVEKAWMIRSLTVDPTTFGGTAATLYAAGYSTILLDRPRNSGIFKSTDGGSSWTTLDEGIPPFTWGSVGGVSLGVVRKVLLDPRSCATPPAEGACTAGPLNTVFAVTAGSGADQRFRIIKSTQGGAAWSPVGASLPVSLINGNPDQRVLPNDLEIDGAGTLYVSLFGDYPDEEGNDFTPTIVSGVFRSDDGGLTWSPRNAGLPKYGASATTTRDVYALAVHPRRAGVLWASTIEPGQSSRIHFSDDGGANWKNVGKALDGCDVRDLQVDPAAPQVVYAAGLALDGNEGCVWRSEDGGLNWSSIGAGLAAHGVYDLRQDPNDRRRLVLATTSGVWQALLPSDRIFNDRED